MLVVLHSLHLLPQRALHMADPTPPPAPEPAWRRALAEIETRLVELGFGTHFLNEMRPFAQAARHAHTPRSATPGLQRLLQQRFHLIGGEELDSLAHSESKLIPHTPFLQHLCCSFCCCAKIGSNGPPT